MPAKKFSAPAFTISPRKRTLRERQDEPFAVGTLGDLHWTALAEAWKARPAGVTPEDEWYGDYAGIRWTIWTHLRNYQTGALVEEYQAHAIYRIRLTPRGERFYRDTWQHYHDLYPGIDAPAPSGGTPAR